MAKKKFIKAAKADVMKEALSDKATEPTTNTKPRSAKEVRNKLYGSKEEK